MPMPFPARVLRQLPGRFAVCRFDANEPVPRWALDGPVEFVSVTRTRAELSVICPVEVLPDPGLAGVEWHCLQIEGPFDFDERGVLASVVDPLAHAGVSVFVVATYDTDYLLVTDIDGARRALLAAGHEIRPAVTDAGTRPNATEGGHR
jgi:hypothetical protein